MSEVVRVGQDEREPVAATIAASFADDPIWQWIYGLDDTIPIDTGIVLARMLVAQSTPVDEIHASPDCGAVALWTAPIGTSDSENDELRAEQTGPYFKAFAAQLGPRISVTASLSDAMRSHRPDERHWYLGILGTHPDRQNQGLGSAVLKAMLAKTDERSIGTYLESSNPQNYAFYRRPGYRDAGVLTVNDSPPLLGFWRPAAAL